MDNELNSSLIFEIFETYRRHEKNSSLASAKWLTTIEAANYLRVSVSSIKMMVYRGQIKVLKLGRRNRFLRKDLDDLIMNSLNKKESV